MKSDGGIRFRGCCRFLNYPFHYLFIAIRLLIVLYCFIYIIPEILSVITSSYTLIFTNSYPLIDSIKEKMSHDQANPTNDSSPTSN
mmetsp:Transcript_13170/g.22329  ORF Transcript_13170/g.22329 Transcript_13170/m.22329 type:complete len:86 (+) Transcript_13170:290-547(+)